MRRVMVPLALLALAASGAGVPAQAEPAPGGFMSRNVTWVATLPMDSPAIGGRVLTVDGQRRFYVSGSKGLSIYDVTNPAVPVPLGTLAMPHFENESVAVSDDGNTVILANDPDFGQPPLTYIVDTSIVTAPHVVGVIPEGTHTATCANAACTHVYGNYGWIYDIRDRANPKAVNGRVGAIHYAARDEAGLLWTAGVVIDPRKNPEKPKILKVGEGGWHNSLRPNAKRYRPRKAGDLSPKLKPGELYISGDETWTDTTCGSGNAGVETWSLVNFDKGVRATRIATIKPVNGDITDGDPAMDVPGCSSHWFDYRKGVVVAGWYDHGVRFIKVDERTGALAQVGYFHPGVTEAWGAYWIDDEYVYTTDAARGIDILRFDRKAPAPTAAEVNRSWRPSFFRPSAATRREQYLCRAAAERSPLR